MDNIGTTMKYDDLFGLVFPHTGHEPFFFQYTLAIYYSNNEILMDFSASKKKQVNHFHGKQAQVWYTQHSKLSAAKGNCC